MLLWNSSRKHDDSKCLFKYDLSANDLPHRVHSYCLLIECVCMCARKFDRSANALPQWAQPYGFSPVCDRKCPCSNHGRENSLPHTPQLCVNLCVNKCMASAGIETYALPQVMHFLADCESRLRCVCLCRLKFDEVAYCLPHCVHL